MDLLMFFMSYQFIFIPQVEQKAAPPVGAPHLGHLFSDTGRPHVGQNAAPGARLVWQLGQRLMFPEDRGLPHVTHLEALVSLSAPHFGHGLY
jgi:hypothetical protein